PSILVEDLAAAHVAIAQVATRESTRAPTAPASTAPDLDARDPATSAEIREVRDDASRGATAAVHAFSEDEEAFFQAGHAVEQHKPRPHDSFDDLDAGYQPPTFWERLWGRKPGGPSKPSK
ncbi:MAG: hypothetical protein KC464_16445, partial [Myxococcales bacterium]|nr:hypothetical protein [Myxococcales bacterium]